MKKKFTFFLSALALIAFRSTAQQVLPCAESQVHQQILLKHPELTGIETDYEAQIKEGIKHIDFSKMTKRTATTDSTGTFWYDIPIVIHIIHNYGSENLSDNDIYNDLINWNIVYAGANTDTANVIPTFKPWVGIPHFRLHLATRDPNGNPTHGIVRYRNYQTYKATDFAKFDGWSPTSYINIWCVNNIVVDNGNAAAYAYEPPEAAVYPYWDGIICDYSYVANSNYTSEYVGKTIDHEMGHEFNLYHPWGNTNFPQVALGDDDVDDTPPTWGHNPAGCRFDLLNSNDNSIYDTMFATNNYKNYTDISGGDSLVNYPDTTNTQNIMDYTYCARMFTKGQVARMQAAANNTLAGRNNLWSDTNLIYTGVLTPALTFAPFPDLKPIPEFSAVTPDSVTDSANYMVAMDYFTIPGRPITFINETWNDTLTSLTWTFSKSASTPSATFTSFTTNPEITNTFTEGGWVAMSMQATGNHTGDTTVNFNNSIFVASQTATPAPGYMQDFNPSGDVANWPSFNYYNNEFKWQLSDSFGYYDNYSIEYLGYDSRILPLQGIYPYTGTPAGDFDDFFSIPFDLSAYSSGSCFLNFFSSAAARSSTSNNTTDTLEIDYMTSTGNWIKIARLGGSQLINKGAVATSYEPSSPNDWMANGITIPSAAISTYTVFRFRYWPGVSSDGYSSGNNFFMDNIHISEWPAAVENVKMTGTDVQLMPNPTNGDAYVIVNDANNTSAQVVVMDVTGKEVYATSKQLSGNMARIQIPHFAISVAGVYMVQATTGSQVTTKKLVVY